MKKPHWELSSIRIDPSFKKRFYLFETIFFYIEKETMGERERDSVSIWCFTFQMPVVPASWLDRGQDPETTSRSLMCMAETRILELFSGAFSGTLRNWIRSRATRTRTMAHEWSSIFGLTRHARPWSRYLFTNVSSFSIKMYGNMQHIYCYLKVVVCTWILVEFRVR